MDKTYIIKNENEFKILKALLSIIDIENQYPEIFLKEPMRYSLSGDKELTGNKILFKNLYDQLTAINILQNDIFFKGKYFFEIPVSDLKLFYEKISPTVELKSSIHDIFISFHENENSQ